MAASSTGPASEKMRKQPRQERAQQTIETIFQTTAQIIDEHGKAALTTNRIAQQAGFSIGTLYQYFPTKEAIIAAMIERERRRVMDQLDALLTEAEAQADVAEQSGAPPLWEPQTLLRRLIRINIEGLGSGKRTRRAMIRFAWAHDHHDNITQALRESAERIAISLQRLRHPGLRSSSPAMMFVVTRAVIGVIRSASLEKSPLLGSPEFEDELVRLAWGMLSA